MPLLVAMVVACVACDSTVPRIVSLSMPVVAESMPTTIEIDTVGCAPTFDVDHGTLQVDPTATVLLSPSGRMLAASRIGNDQFTVVIPGSLLAGDYSVDLVLSDGRTAHFNGALHVEHIDAQIVDVRSVMGAVALGERNVPISVTLLSQSHCYIDGLVLVPTFSRGGVDQTADFVVHSHDSPFTLYPYQGDRHTVTLSVDVGPTATAGPIDIHVAVMGGVLSGDATCTGTATLTSVAGDAAWMIVPASAEVLTIQRVSATPVDSTFTTFEVLVLVRNPTAGTITLESLDVSSDPPGVALIQPPQTLFPVQIPSQGAAQFLLQINLTVDLVDALASAQFTLSATGRTDSGMVITSRRDGEAVFGLGGH